MARPVLAGQVLLALAGYYYATTSSDKGLSRARGILGHVQFRPESP
jgi:hypothetical protein